MKRVARLYVPYVNGKPVEGALAMKKEQAMRYYQNWLLAPYLEGAGNGEKRELGVVWKTVPYRVW